MNGEPQRASVRNQSKLFRLAKHHQFSSEALQSFVDSAKGIPLPAVEQLKRGKTGKRAHEPVDFDSCVDPCDLADNGGGEEAFERRSRPRTGSIGGALNSTCKGECDSPDSPRACVTEEPLGNGLRAVYPQPVVPKSRAQSLDDSQDDSGSDFPPDEEVAEALEEMQTLDVRAACPVSVEALTVCGRVHPCRWMTAWII